MINIKRFPRLVKSFQVNDIQPIESVKKNPEQFLSESLTTAHKKIFNELLKFATRYEDLYVRQDTIANKLGYCRKTINRAIQHLVSLGLLNKAYRANHACLYRVSSWFSDFFVRKKLQKIFYALAWIPTTLSPHLLLAEISLQTEMSHDTTLLFKGDIYKNNNHYNTTLPAGARAREMAGENNKSNEEKSSRLMESGRVVSKKGRGGMGESVIEEICSRYPMNPMQLQQLENYSEGILQKALSVTNGSAFVDNRSAYLLGICKKLKERADNPPTRSDNAHKPQETKSSSYQPFQVETQAEKQQKKSALMEIARKHRAVRDEHIKGVKGSSSSGVQENNMTIDNLVEQVKLYDELAKENPFFYYAKMSAINKYNAQNAAEFVQAEVVSSPEKQKSDTSNGFRRLFDI